MDHAEIKTALRAADAALRSATEKAIAILASRGFEPGRLVENEKGVYRITYISLVRYLSTNPEKVREFEPAIYGVKLLRNGRFGDHTHYVGNPTYEWDRCFVRPYVEREAA